MSGFFGSILKGDCVSDVFYGTDYHSHLGTKRAGLVFYSENEGFQRAIHSLEDGYFRNKFENSPSIHNKRLFVTVIPEKENGNENTAPLKGFKNFFKKVDKHLYNIKKDEDRKAKNVVFKLINGIVKFPRYKSSEVCTFNSSGNLFGDTDIGVFLNNTYIGNYSKEFPLNYSCELLKEAKNSLTFRPLSSKGVNFEEENLDLDNLLGEENQLEKYKVYMKRRDRSFRSIKIVFYKR